MPSREREELERFFALAVLTEDKEMEIEGWADAESAEALIVAAPLTSRGAGAP